MSVTEAPDTPRLAANTALGNSNRARFNADKLYDEPYTHTHRQTHTRCKPCLVHTDERKPVRARVRAKTHTRARERASAYTRTHSDGVCVQACRLCHRMLGKVRTCCTASLATRDLCLGVSEGSLAQCLSSEDVRGYVRPPAAPCTTAMSSCEDTHTHTHAHTTVGAHMSTQLRWDVGTCWAVLVARVCMCVRVCVSIGRQGTEHTDRGLVQDMTG